MNDISNVCSDGEKSQSFVRRIKIIPWFNFPAFCYSLSIFVQCTWLRNSWRTNVEINYVLINDWSEFLIY